MDVKQESSNKFTFEFVMTGQGNELYSGGDLRCLDIPGQTPPPKFKILDENGKSVATGKFEYG